MHESRHAYILTSAAVIRDLVAHVIPRLVVSKSIHLDDFNQSGLLLLDDFDIHRWKDTGAHAE